MSSLSSMRRTLPILLPWKSPTILQPAFVQALCCCGLGLLSIPFCGILLGHFNIPSIVLIFSLVNLCQLACYWHAAASVNEIAIIDPDQSGAINEVLLPSISIRLDKFVFIGMPWRSMTCHSMDGTWGKRLGLIRSCSTWTNSMQS